MRIGESERGVEKKCSCLQSDFKCFQQTHNQNWRPVILDSVVGPMYARAAQLAVGHTDP